MVDTGALQALGGAISTGKEAVVYRGLLRLCVDCTMLLRLPSHSRWNGRDVDDEDEDEDEDDEEDRDDAGAPRPEAASRPTPTRARRARVAVAAAAPVPVAIKVFKPMRNEFTNREAYIRGDWRYARRLQHCSPRRLLAVRSEGARRAPARTAPSCWYPHSAVRVRGVVGGSCGPKRR
jgi:serine/threonine-protein kinase RIO1